MFSACQKEASISSIESVAPMAKSSELSQSVAASQYDENFKEPFSFIIDGCDEPVYVEGIFHLVYHSNVSNSGMFLIDFHNFSQGKGIGLSTGAKYIFNSTVNLTIHGTAGYIETYADNFNFIGQGNVRDLSVKYKIHITINANGKLTVDFNEYELECR